MTYENLHEHILTGMTYYQETCSIEKGYEYLSYVKADRVEKLMYYKVFKCDQYDK